jgi:integrative and conjugative element protein (TIGR02256 family)
MTAPRGHALGPVHAPQLFTVEIHAEALATITEQVRIGGTVLETGGILLGHNRHDCCAIRVAGEPGPNAVRHRRAFSRDRAHAEGLADAAWADHQATWVGEWHTHPEGLATPSDIDLASYLDHLNDPDLGFAYFISLIIALQPRRQQLAADQPNTASVPAVMTAWVVRADGVEPAHITTPQESS